MKLEVDELPEPVLKALRDAVCDFLRTHEVQGACGFAVSVLRAKGRDHTISSTAAAVPFPFHPPLAPPSITTNITIMHLTCIREPAMWQAIADNAAHSARMGKGGPVQ